MTRKELARKEFEDHFYATWPNTIKAMKDQDLVNLNNDRLCDITSSHPETLICLKHWVLHELANRGL